jgi:hypothetical protein
LHGKDVLIKNHTRICPYFYCECDKCKELLDIRKLTSRKRRLQPESDQIADSSSSTISPKTPNIVLNAPNPFFLDNKTGQPPLAPSKIPPYQPVQVQINPVIRPNNTFQLLPNYSTPTLLTIQPTLAPINYSNIFVPNNQILDTANNDQFKQMLFFQNLISPDPLTIQPNVAPINNSNLFFHNNHVLNVKDNDWLNEMLFSGSYDCQSYFKQQMNCFLNILSVNFNKVISVGQSDILLTIEFQFLRVQLEVIFFRKSTF